MSNAVNRNNQPEKTSQTEQYVLNYSFDEIYKILMVGLAAFNSSTNNYDRIQIDNGTGGIKISNASDNLAVIIDTSVANTVYIGKAAIATATSAASWQIAKLDTSTGMAKTWADGDANFDNVWNNRTSLTYA